MIHSVDLVKLCLDLFKFMVVILLNMRKSCLFPLIQV